ncbi:MAG: CDP-alcohol phosphatidyltransferase family protein [Actinomycetota bacterium]
MLNARIRGIWDRGMRPVGGFVGRSGITPNQITIAGVTVQGVVSYLIVIDRLVEAGLVLVAAALLDTVDGAVAKARGLTTSFGALLDSTMDRLSDALVFLPIAWLYLADPTPERADQQWVAALALVTLVLSFLVSYTKARAEGLGYDCNVGLIERAERLIIMILALVFNALLPLALLLLALASLLTFGQRILHVRKQTSVR